MTPFAYLTSINENGGQPFHQLKWTFRNDGIPLHDVTIHLRFLSLDGRGTKDIELTPPTGRHEEQAVFSTGMVGDFYLNSYSAAPFVLDWLAEIENAVKQRAEFVVKTQGRYEAARIRVGRWWDRWLIKWNSLAVMVNYRFSRKLGVNEHGIDMIHIPTILQPCNRPLYQLEHFTDSLRRERK